MSVGDQAARVRQTLVFAAVLIALLSFARSGAAPATMQLVFTVFVVVATIWLRAQYVDSLDNQQWVIPRRLGYGLLAVAAVLFASYLLLHRGGLALLGVLLAYYLAGSAMTELRQRDTVELRFRGRTATVRPMRWGPWLTAAGVLLAVAGFAALGQGSGLGWTVLDGVLLGTSVVLLLPVGVSLLSERTVRRLSQSDRSTTRWRWAVGLGGVVVFAAMTAAAVVLSHSAWLLTAMAAVGLLVTALVSATQADIAMVMAVVALMGVTPLQARVPHELDPNGGDRVLVALGDSYMSGEGAAIYYRGTDEGGGDQCRRSPTSWAAMAAQLPQFNGLELLACSGARTVNVLPARPFRPPTVPAPEPQAGEGHTQLDGYRADHLDRDGKPRFTPRLVVLSIGGNDAGFSTIGVMCLAPGNCSEKAELWTSALEQVRGRLRATYAEVDKAFPDTPVAVVPYPDPIALDGACSEAALSDSERRFVHSFLTGDGVDTGLNPVIRETAEEYGFYYLARMQDALVDSHLRLCDPLNDGRPGLNFIGLRSVRGIAEQRFNPVNWSHTSLHPNERGHAAMLRVFETWLAEQPTRLRPREPIPSVASDRATAASNAPVEPAAEQAPPCDLFDPSPKGCRPQGQQWAAQQLGLMLVTKGWVGLLAAAGAWAAAVALFSWRRRPWDGRMW
jgi:hypothetical protein